ncbi:VOC family protein [Cytophagaceae bacterium ABcell3]|nr:VOC family protein [Cytophagaceae bacterium ABcell3]
MKNVKPVPEGYHNITPYLVVENALAYISFLKDAFNAQEKMKTLYPDGKVMHAEVRIGDSNIMLSEANPDFPPTQVIIHFYTENVDDVYQKSLKAGGVSTMEPALQFYGDRSAGVKDPFGNTWWISTHVEDVSPEEMQRRQENFVNQEQ